VFNGRFLAQSCRCRTLLERQLLVEASKAAICYVRNTSIGGGESVATNCVTRRDGLTPWQLFRPPSQARRRIEVVVGAPAFAPLAA